VFAGTAETTGKHRALYDQLGPHFKERTSGINKYNAIQRQPGSRRNRWHSQQTKIGSAAMKKKPPVLPKTKAMIQSDRSWHNGVDIEIASTPDLFTEPLRPSRDPGSAA
jgi:hypothetical protein